VEDLPAALGAFSRFETYADGVVSSGSSFVDGARASRRRAASRMRT
jgi:hypothetical protein